MDARFYIWFARGLDARRKSVDAPGSSPTKVTGRSVPAVNFKGCQLRKQAYEEGRQWGHILMNQAKEPPELDFLDDVVRQHFEKARKLTGSDR